MTTPASDGLVGVWDCNDRSGMYWQHWREASDWARAHLREPDSTYRAEFALMDAPYATLYRYKRGADGHPVVEDGELVTEVVVQVLDELPPAGLL